MVQTFNIKYLLHRQIDKAKWDRCIKEADNGLVYGYSFYLDHMEELVFRSDQDAIQDRNFNL